MNCFCCGQPLPEDLSSQINELFDSFWQRYPRKVGKKGAYKAWLRLNPSQALVNRIWRTLWWQREYLWDDYKYIPHPATWLNQERFDDEPPPEIQTLINQKEVGPMVYPEREDATDRHAGREGSSAEGTDG